METTSSSDHTYYRSRSPGRRSPVRRSPGRRSPVRRSPGRRSPVRRSPVRRSPVRRSPGRRSPVRRSPDRRSPGRRSPGRRSPDRRSPGRRSPGRRYSRSRSPEHSYSRSRSPEHSYPRSPSSEHSYSWNRSLSRRYSRSRSPGRRHSRSRSPSRRYSRSRSPGRRYSGCRSSVRRYSRSSSSDKDQHRHQFFPGEMIPEYLKVNFQKKQTRKSPNISAVTNELRDQFKPYIPGARNKRAVSRKEILKSVELTCQRKHLEYQTATGAELEYLDRIKLGTQKLEFGENWTPVQIDRQIRRLFPKLKHVDVYDLCVKGRKKSNELVWPLKRHHSMVRDDPRISGKLIHRLGKEIYIVPVCRDLAPERSSLDDPIVSCDSCARNIPADEYSSHLRNCEAQSGFSDDFNHQPTNEDGPENREYLNVEVILSKEDLNKSIASDVESLSECVEVGKQSIENSNKHLEELRDLIENIVLQEKCIEFLKDNAPHSGVYEGFIKGKKT